MSTKPPLNVVIKKQGRSKEQNVYPAEKARQGRIVLRRRWQKLLFIIGLAGFLILLLLLRLGT